MGNQKNIIGVDFGATNIRVGKIVNSEIVEVFKQATPAEGSEQQVMDKFIETVEECFDENTAFIGVGVPSVVDVSKGIVYDVVNIPSWKEVHLKDILTSRFKVPVFVNNDSNCFAAGEKIYGRGKNYQHIVGMTMGSGLGLGLIINGKLYEGKNCGAGEFGMVPYLDNVFETYCSGQFFSIVKNVNAAEAHTKAKEGNTNAIELFKEFGKHVGVAVKSILYAYDPEIIIMGGSLSKTFALFKDSIYEEIATFAFRDTIKNLKIEVSEIADSAILGAAALHMGSVAK